MKITDLQEGRKFNHKNKGLGVIIKLKPRTIITKYQYSTTATVLRTKDTDFTFQDL